MMPDTDVREPEFIEPQTAAPDPGDLDPDAPYGRRDDGTPYKRSAETRERLAAHLNAARTARMGAPTKRRPGRPTGAARRQGASSSPSSPSSPSSARPTPRPAPDYRPTIEGLVGLGTMALGMLGRYSPALLLDAATVTIHTPGIVKVVNDVAQEDDRIGALLDKAAAVGPYGAVVALCLTLGAQFAANHKVIEPTPALGILDESGLAQALEEYLKGFRG